MASRGVRLLACAWALAAAAQTSSEELAESTDARNALTLALPNASTAAGNASTTTCDLIVRIGYPEGLAPYAVAAPTRWLDGEGACFAFYRHQSGQRALEKIQGGDLDMAIFGTSVFAEAVERGAGITFVWSDHISDSVEGLVATVGEPQALRGTTILTPRYSTAHYHLLAFLEGVAIDAADITIEFAEPAEIVQRWTLGTIDGAACWTSCFDYLRMTPSGGDTPGTLLFDSETLQRWGYSVAGTLVARNDFLAAEPALVQRVVSRFARANADYVRDPRAAGWGAGGRYADLVGRFYTLDLGEAATMPFPVVERYLSGLRYPSLELQLAQLNLLTPFRKNIDFFYAQKLLAEPPYSIYQPGLYARFISQDFVRGALATEDVPLDSAPDALPAFVPNAVPAQLVVPGEGCEALTVLDGEASFSDGSTGTNAYQPNAICVWALRSPTGCVALDVTFLYTEGSDKLEVFSSSGDLLVSLSGRPRRRDDAWNTTNEGCVDDAAPPPPGVDGVRAALYVRWTTDGHDEQVIGGIEPVGFEASTREIDAVQNEVCPPGWSGTRCDAPHCVGVVDVVGDSGTIASQTYTDSYKPNSRCGWRIAAKGQRIVVDITRLGMERVHDRVLFAKGSATPPGFGLRGDWSPDDGIYQFRNGRRPDGPLVFDHDIFIAFETDGVGNAPRDGGNAGLELRWRLESADAPLCPDIHLCGAHGRCVDGKCICDPGYYGKLCVFDSCQNRAEQAEADAGHILSGATDDYEPATECGWIIDVKGRRGVRITGIRLHIDKFDLEVAEGFATTTDAVALGVRARGERGPALLAIFRGGRGPRGERVVSVARPADPLTTTKPNDIVTTPFVEEDFAEGAFISIELPAWLPAELIPEVGAGLGIGLEFKSDANNPEPFSGFDIGYAPLYEDGTYCDDHWPCSSGQTCKDNLCVKKKNSRAGKKFKRRAKEVGIGLAIALGVVIAALGAYYARRVVEQKDALEAERAHVVRDQCDEARRAVEDFQAPFCVIPADAFCALGSLRPHEELRDGRRLDDANAVQLEFFDGLRDVEAARSGGAVMVFLSHQWLGTRHPDPAGTHYRAMCAALRSVADDAGCELSAIRAWVDVISIPQANMATQSLAVSSLPAYASCVDYFIVFAPSVVHADTGLACDSTTYRKRAWCRAEVFSCWARRGSRRMYVSTNQGLRSLFGHGSPGQPDGILLECLKIFEGDLTCCVLGHPEGECDFESLVSPILGLVAEIYRERHERPGAWALLKDRLDELFPHTFEYKLKSGASVELPLFGDLALAMIRIVDHEETKRGPVSPEQLLRGFAPGTSGQRHSPLAKSPQHRLARTPTQRHSPPSSGTSFRSRLDLFRSPSAVLRGLSSRTIVDSSNRDSSQSTGGAESISLAPAPADDLWANSPPGSRTNASTPREVSWTDPEAVERRHITLQPSLPKEPSPDRDVRV